MNKSDREKVANLIVELSGIKDTIDEMASDEQGKFDGMPEGLQQAESGQAIEAAATGLADASSALEEVLSTLGELA